LNAPATRPSWTPACVIAGALALAFLSGLPAPQAAALAVVVFAIGLWASAAWPEHVTTLAFFLLALLAGVAPPEVVFSGFQSGAWWLILSGLIVGVAIKQTGLGERIAARLTAGAHRSYAGTVTAIVLAGGVFTFLMPSSMGRTVMLMPIALAFAGRLGYARGSRGYTGIAMAAVLGAYLPSAAVLPANLPNVVLAAAAEQLYGIRVSYGEYLLLHLPVLGIAKSILMIAVITTMFGEAPRGVAASPASSGPAPWSRGEKQLAIVLGFAVGMWMTDFVHGIPPAWIGLAAAVVCMLPVLGLVPSESFSRDISWIAVIHAAGVIGLGAVVAHSGLGAVLGEWLAAIAPFRTGEPLWNFWLVSTIGTIVCLFTTTPGVPAVMTPLSGALADASGLSLYTVLMSQAIGFSNLLLPYEGAPLVFAIHYAGVSLTQATRVLLVLGAATLVLLTPLTYGWWLVLGRAP
jgi:di/tricarboxylate transporter